MTCMGMERDQEEINDINLTIPKELPRISLRKYKGIEGCPWEFEEPSLGLLISIS